MKNYGIIKSSLKLGSKSNLFDSIKKRLAAFFYFGGGEPYQSKVTTNISYYRHMIKPT